VASTPIPTAEDVTEAFERRAKRPAPNDRVPARPKIAGDGERPAVGVAAGAVACAPKAGRPGGRALVGIRDRDPAPP